MDKKSDARMKKITFSPKYYALPTPSMLRKIGDAGQIACIGIAEVLLQHNPSDKSWISLLLIAGVLFKAFTNFFKEG